MKHCYVVGAGDFAAEAFHPEPEDYVIACDGGYRYCLESGRIPDLVIGDFDSLGKSPEHHNVRALNPVKDETDMACGCAAGIELGYRSLILFGGTGGRLSHTMANIRLMDHLAGQGMECVLIGHNCRIRTLRAGRLILPAQPARTISVFSCSRASGVTLRGLKYPLTDATLAFDNPLGVSNEPDGSGEIVIEVKEGGLIIMEEFDTQA